MPLNEAIVMAFNAPPVDGIGTTGGFKVMLKDVGNRGLEALQGAADNLTRAGSATPGLAGVFSTFRVGQPQLYLDVDRTKAKAAGVPLSASSTRCNRTSAAAYANDFTFEGRNWQVTVQADAQLPRHGRGHRPAEGPQRRRATWSRWRRCSRSRRSPARPSSTATSSTTPRT